MSENFSGIISLIMTAVANSSLYSSEHPSVSEFSGKALEIIEGLYVDDSFTITLLGNTLLINGELFNERTIHIRNFIRKLRTKGIDRVIIKKGITPKEFEAFVLALASKDSLRSSPNISVGIVEVKFKDEYGDIRGFMDENISKVRDVYEGVSRFKELDMVGLDGAVAGFISVLKKESNVLNILSPVKAYSDYTYVHITNVAVLTLFQAETLGLKGDTLREAGFAGLLHDAGKLFISKKVLEKPGKLDQDEWAEMKQHPILGALYLSTLPEAPKLAVIAAYEHHMKFDGSGYPDTKRQGKKQHLISQLVSISDFFDALRTARPYRRNLELKEIAGLMKEAGEKDFNPMLINNFLGAFSKISAF